MIIPAHWELVRAKQAGREPDPRWNARGKQRSVHNNYLTLPVVFAMLSNHFPFTYGHAHGWLVLVALMAIGAWLRHYFNLRHQGRERLVDPGDARRSGWSRSRSDPAARRAAARPGPAPSFAQVQAIVAAALRAVPLAAPDEARRIRAAGRDRPRHAREDRAAAHR